jgi:hypothetical protein
VVQLLGIIIREYEAAEAALFECIIVRYQIGQTLWVIEALELYTTLLVRRSQYDKALLIGAATGNLMREDNFAIVDNSHIQRELIAELGQQESEAIIQDAEAMTYEDVVSYVETHRPINPKL